MKRTAAITLFAAACLAAGAAGAVSGRQALQKEYAAETAAEEVQTEDTDSSAAASAASSLPETESAAEEPAESIVDSALESAASGTESVREQAAVIPAEKVLEAEDESSVESAVESALSEVTVESMPEAVSEVSAIPNAESIPEAASGAEAPESSDALITLGFAGDINFDESWATTQFMDTQSNGIRDAISEDAIRLMNGFDLFMINNEFTYSTRGAKIDKTYHFRANPERVENLKILGADIVLLANNHVFDYGEDAFYDTLDTLNQAGIPYVGAGKDLEEASAAHYFEINGRTIAYVAATEAEQYESAIHTQAAGEQTPGVFACYDETAFLESIRKASENSDFVVASVHWGMEYDEHYRADQKALAEAMTEAGADAIIGTHTHCLEGIQFIDETPVFYSLGNFWFNDKNLYTGMAELTLRIPEEEDEEIVLEKTRFIPCTQYSLVTKLVTDHTEKQTILQYMKSISGEQISFDEDGTVHPAA
ncbi:MAG: CapA family protein [Lachnospiraceae bacterium]|nr:CapA family protein [Lachnospiraceae bacterium]